MLWSARHAGEGETWQL